MAQQGLGYIVDTDQKNNYLYNGKEQDGLTRFYEYGFRDYDAQIGRWHVTDPMAEMYGTQSPYHFAGNNPVNNLEINGAVYQRYERLEWERENAASGGSYSHFGESLFGEDFGEGYFEVGFYDYARGGGEVGPSLNDYKEWQGTGGVGTVGGYWWHKQSGGNIESWLRKNGALTSFEYQDVSNRYNNNELGVQLNADGTYHIGAVDKVMAWVPVSGDPQQEWPTEDELEKDFALSFEEVVMDNYVNDPNYMPTDPKNVAKDLLHSGNLSSDKHYFGLKPIAVRVKAIQNNQLISNKIYNLRNYINNNLPTVFDPGYIEEILFTRIGIEYTFVIQYQIHLPL